MTLFYFGYLQRDPGPGLHMRLEQFEADGDTRALTAGFLQSREYRARLGGDSRRDRRYSRAQQTKNE